MMKFNSEYQQELHFQNLTADHRWSLLITTTDHVVLLVPDVWLHVCLILFHQLMSQQNIFQVNRLKMFTCSSQCSACFRLHVGCGIIGGLALVRFMMFMVMSSLKQASMSRQLICDGDLDLTSCPGVRSLLHCLNKMFPSNPENKKVGGVWAELPVAFWQSAIKQTASCDHITTITTSLPASVGSTRHLRQEVDCLTFNVHQSFSNCLT